MKRFLWCVMFCGLFAGMSMLALAQCGPGGCGGFSSCPGGSCGGFDSYVGECGGMCPGGVCPAGNGDCGGLCPNGTCPGSNCGDMGEVPVRPKFYHRPPECDYPALCIVDCRQGRATKRATGTIVDHNDARHTDVVLTCAHSYQRGDEVIVSSSEGVSHRARILACDHTTDVCILEIAQTGIAPMKIATRAPQSGAAVWMCGFRAGEHFMATRGKVSRLSGTNMFTSANTDEGCSGGPFLNQDGEIIGTVTAKSTMSGPGPAMGPCVPIAFRGLQCEKITATEQATLYYCQQVVLPWESHPKELLPYRRNVDGKLDGIQKSEQEMHGEIGQISGDVRDITARLATPPAPIIVQSAPAPAASAPSTDPAIAQAIANLNGTVNQHGQAINDLSKGQKELGGKLDAADKLAKETAANVEKHGTFLERLTADKAAVAQQEPDASKFKQELDALKDAILHKAPDAPAGSPIDDKLRTVLMVGLVVGILTLIAVLTVWNVVHGKGLFRQLIDKVAAAHPDNARLQAFATKVDTGEDHLADKIKAHLPAAVAAALAANPALGAVAPVAQAIGSTATAEIKGQVAALQAQLAGLNQSVVSTALATPAPSQTSPAATAKPASNLLPVATPPAT